MTQLIAHKNINISTFFVSEHNLLYILYPYIVSALLELVLRWGDSTICLYCVL